jgi:D-psicose/D-tagatose/L-ribulose 3-epimerase
MDWAAIGRALNEIGYSGAVVMEPFVLQGGQVGKDIKVWREIAPSGEAELDDAARKSAAFIREMFSS